MSTNEVTFTGFQEYERLVPIMWPTPLISLIQKGCQDIQWYPILALLWDHASNAEFLKGFIRSSRWYRVRWSMVLVGIGLSCQCYQCVDLGTSSPSTFAISLATQENHRPPIIWREYSELSCYPVVLRGLSSYLCLIVFASTFPI